MHFFGQAIAEHENSHFKINKKMSYDTQGHVAIMHYLNAYRKAAYNAYHLPWIVAGMAAERWNKMPLDEKSIFIEAVREV